MNTIIIYILAFLIGTGIFLLARFFINWYFRNNEKVDELKKLNIKYDIQIQLMKDLIETNKQILNENLKNN